MIFFQVFKYFFLTTFPPPPLDCVPELDVGDAWELDCDDDGEMSCYGNDDDGDDHLREEVVTLNVDKRKSSTGSQVFL